MTSKNTPRYRFFFLSQKNPLYNKDIVVATIHLVLILGFYVFFFFEFYRIFFGFCYFPWVKNVRLPRTLT